MASNSHRLPLARRQGGSSCGGVASQSPHQPQRGTLRRRTGLLGRRLLMLALATLVSTFFVISFVITAGLLPGVGSSGAPLGRGSQAHAVAAQFVGTLLDTRYGVAGNFSHLAINYSVPRSLSAATRLYYAAHSGLSCGDLARRIEEPLTKHYRPTGRHPQPLPGGVPRAAWRWEGRISRALFNSVPFLLRDAPAAQGCVHCTFVLRYKVLNGRLYADMTRRRRALDGQEGELEMLEGMMLAALHIHKVPDVDFLLHLGDGSPAGLPLLQASINRGVARAGFTLPKFAWRDALGPTQLAAHAECLAVRHSPGAGRTQRAVWRGSSTDRERLIVDESNVLMLTRTRLHMFGMWYPQLIDAHFTSYVQTAFSSTCVQDLLPAGPPLALEALNGFAVALDVDGNGWSDRYRLLAHGNTPVLKQASNLTAFFEHAMPPGIAREPCASDLHDLPVRVAELLHELRTAPGRLQAMAERQQGLAHLLLSQSGVLHATAYALANIANLSDWKPVMETNYEPVPPHRCCSANQALPRGFANAVAQGTVV